MKIIGIVMRIEEFEHVFKWFVNESYLNAIERLGVAAFPISSYASLNKAIKVCDGLLIPGGYDIQSYYLKEERNTTITTYERSMDHFDFACIDEFVKARKPILGICRGMQLLNVYLQGELEQHIDTTIHSINHEHSIHIQEDSFLAQLYPLEHLVNSYHHQVVKQLGIGLKLSALAADGNIEAFEHSSLPILGVQWHPEKMIDDQVIPYFLDIVCK